MPTHSAKIVTDLLRTDSASQGSSFPTISRCGPSQNDIPSESGRQRIRAGCDVLLVCKDVELAERYAALMLEALTRRLISRSVQGGGGTIPRRPSWAFKRALSFD